MKNDDFGDRMKSYEKAYTSYKVKPPQIMCVRLDGKGFSKFTKRMGFKKPFDIEFSDVMIDTCKYLVKETNADIGYTQSDEITLIYKPTEKQSEYIFGGKVSKINSTFAAMTTLRFYKEMSKVLKVDFDAHFDCRTWAVDSDVEANNVVLWRAQDARRNSVSQAYRWITHQKKMPSQEEMKSILLNKFKYDWEKENNKFKYGTVFFKFKDDKNHSYIEYTNEYFGDIINKTKSIGWLTCF